MGWIDLLKGYKIGLDTSPLIYLTEANTDYKSVVKPFFEAVRHNEFTVVTSMVSVVEVLIHPIRNNDTDLIQTYRDLLFKTRGLKTVSLSQRIAEEAARLRATNNIRTPDSIQMATAIVEKASFFLTNDKQLPSLPNLKILLLDDLKKGP
ncbi:MAG TPA: PIN domain-containing protein [Ktedonobacteraceae bacterium]|nr:PIN domain-containing protein [Ktedonobacteraceae bacterium]